MHTDARTHGPLALLPGQTVPAGTELRTDSDSTLEVAIASADVAITAHLGAQTSLVIDTTTDPVRWTLREGELVVSAVPRRHPLSTTFVIDTLAGFATRWNGTGRISHRSGSVPLTVETLEGSIIVASPPDRAVLVQTGSSIIFDKWSPENAAVTPLNPTARTYIASTTVQMRNNADRFKLP